MKKKIYYERKDLLEYLKTYVSNPYIKITWASILDEVPKADVEPIVYAQWDSECEPSYVCTNCKHRFDIYDKVERCPHCGAIMKV